MDLIYGKLNGLLTNWFWNECAVDFSNEFYTERFHFFFFNPNHMMAHKTSLSEHRLKREKNTIVMTGGVIYLCSCFPPMRSCLT